MLSAQRDHFSTRCSELESQLQAAQAQLSAKFTLKDLATNDTSIFESETLERLREWKKCLDFVIGEKEDAERREIERGNGKREGEGKKVKETGAELPFSQLGLSGFLTSNHRLTQKHTEYPDPKPKMKKGKD